MSNHTYKINEIFYSLQGEGTNTGMAAIFVRFSGCNLRCPFCDTDFMEGENMTAQEIVAKCIGYGCHNIILTGGEPTLQVDAELVELFHRDDFYVCIETNGTHPVLGGVDYITCSPKIEFSKNAQLAIDFCNELKVVYNGKNDMKRYDNIHCVDRYLQPCDTGDPIENRNIIKKCVRYIKEHPEWKLSLQTQKIINIR